MTGYALVSLYFVMFDWEIMTYRTTPFETLVITDEGATVVYIDVGAEDGEGFLQIGLVKDEEDDLDLDWQEEGKTMENRTYIYIPVRSRSGIWQTCDTNSSK